MISNGNNNSTNTTYKMNVYNPEAITDDAVYERLCSTDTNDKMVYLTYKAVSCVCPGMGTWLEEVELLTKIMNAADKRVQQDPIFALSCLTYAFRLPQHYNMWSKIKPVMRDNPEVVGTLCSGLGMHRGTEYASTLLACVSQSSLAKAQFQDKLIELGAYEVVKYASHKKRHDQDWVIGILGKAVDYIHRVIPYIEPHFLRDLKFVYKLWEINARAVLELVDPEVWVDTHFVDMMFERTKWAYQDDTIPLIINLLGFPRIALAVAKYRSMWDFYADSCPSNITNDPELMCKLALETNGRAMTIASDDVLRDKDTFFRMLASVGDFEIFSAIKGRKSYILDHHFGDTADIEDFSSLSEGKVLFVLPDRLLENPSTCSTILKKIRKPIWSEKERQRRIEFSGFDLKESIHWLAVSSPSFKRHKSDKDFLLACMADYHMAYGMIIFADKGLFSDVEFVYKLLKKRVELIGLLVLDIYESRSSEFDDDLVNLLEDDDDNHGSVSCVSAMNATMLRDVRITAAHAFHEFDMWPDDARDDNFVMPPFGTCENLRKVVAFAGKIKWCYKAAFEDAASDIDHLEGEEIEQAEKDVHCKFMKNLDDAIALLEESIQKSLLASDFDASWKDDATRTKINGIINELHIEYLQPVIDELDKSEFIFNDNVFPILFPNKRTHPSKSDLYAYEDDQACNKNKKPKTVA